MPSQPVPPDILENAVSLLLELTAISSPTGDVAGLTRCSERLARALRNAGLDTTVEHRRGLKGDEPVIFAGAVDAAAPLLLIGHVDTVLPARAPVRQGERLLATGSADMKAGLVALVGALHTLEAHGRRPPDDLLLVVVPDEEVMGPITRWAMTSHGARARAVWVLEPGKRLESTPAADGETIVGARRGMVHWRLAVEGRSAHAGNDFWLGHSALVAASRWASAVAALAGTGDGPTVNPARLVAGDGSFVDNLARSAALVGTARQLNVVPDRAVVEGEARFLTREDGEQLLERMKQLTRDLDRREGLAAHFHHEPILPPLEPHPIGRQWAEIAVSLAADAGWPLHIERNRGGLSFPNLLPDPAAVPVLDGLGPTGGGLHTREEFVDLRSLARRIGLLTALLARDASEQDRP